MKLAFVRVPEAFLVFTRTPFVTLPAHGAAKAPSVSMDASGLPDGGGSVPAGQVIVVSPAPLSVGAGNVAMTMFVPGWPGGMVAARSARANKATVAVVAEPDPRCESARGPWAKLSNVRFEQAQLLHRSPLRRSVVRARVEQPELLRLARSGGSRVRRWRGPGFE